MDNLEESSDRSPFELTLFAIAFFAALVAVGGVVVGSPAVAALGGVFTLVSVFVFFVRSML